MNSTCRNSGRRIFRSLSNRPQRGYSIFDLMVTSAVAGVIGLGAVGMNGLIQNTRMTAALNQLMGHLNLARSEAIRRGIPVTLCKTENGVDCASGSTWHKGWIIFVDANADHYITAGETVVQIEQSLDMMTLNFSGALNHDRYVTYKPDGSAEPNGTFTFCDGRGAGKAKAVILLGTGRPRTSSLSSSGGPLTCS